MVPPDCKKNKIVVLSGNESVPINSMTPFLLTSIIIISPLVSKNFNASEIQKPLKVVYLFQFGTGVGGHNRNYQLFPKG